MVAYDQDVHARRNDILAELHDLLLLASCIDQSLSGGHWRTFGPIPSDWKNEAGYAEAAAMIDSLRRSSDSSDSCTVKVDESGGELADSELSAADVRERESHLGFGCRGLDGF